VFFQPGLFRGQGTDVVRLVGDIGGRGALEFLTEIDAVTCLSGSGSIQLIEAALDQFLGLSDLFDDAVLLGSERRRSRILWRGLQAQPAGVLVAAFGDAGAAARAGVEFEVVQQPFGDQSAGQAAALGDELIA
jgi:hypothetical protein